MSINYCEKSYSSFFFSNQLNSQTVGLAGSEQKFWPDLKKFQAVEPRHEDLYALVSMSNVKLGQVNKPHQQLGCRLDYDITKDVNMESDYVCMLPPETKKAASLPASPLEFEEAQKIVECGVDLENDNNLLKIKDQNDPNVKIRNDVGYTFGYFGKCRVETHDRITIYELNSKLYTEHTGGRQDGLIPIRTYEIQKTSMTTITPTGTEGLNRVTKFGVTYASDKGDGPALAVQDYWHSQDMYQNLRYKAVKGDFSKLTAEAQIGLQKFMSTDVGQLKCMASGTALVGMNSVGQPMVTVDFRGEVNTGALGGRNASTPLAYAAVIQNYMRTGSDYELNQKLEGGVSIMVTKSSAVTVGAAVGQHKTNMAKGIKQDGDPIKTVYVRFSRKFN